MRNRILLSPGPVQINNLRWKNLPAIHHRSEKFRKIVLEIESMLSRLAGTESPVYLLTASGTGAMESAIANLTIPGSRVLVVSGGKFGDRWKEISDAFGCATDLLRFESGKRVDPAMVAARVEETSPEYITLTHVESSTGLLLELGQLMESMKRPRPVVILDAIASLGVEEVRMDEWGVDLLVGAGQKALAAPPGISFVLASERALDISRHNRRNAYYMSYALYEKGRKSGDIPFTPAVQAVQLLHESLTGIFDEGAIKCMDRHRSHSTAFVGAARYLGLVPLADIPSASVQAMVLPQEADAVEVIGQLAENEGFIIAGGQGELKGRIIRTGFLGMHPVEVLERLIYGLANALGRYDFPIDVENAMERIRSI